jgi:hypothetical protein
MELEHIYKSFIKMDWETQLGNLASTLAKISSRATSPTSDKLVLMSLREAALLIEWSAPNVPPEHHLDLATMQRELLAWRKVWPLEEARPLLALHARNMSDRLLYKIGYGINEESYNDQ